MNFCGPTSAALLGHECGTLSFSRLWLLHKAALERIENVAITAAMRQAEAERIAFIEARKQRDTHFELQSKVEELEKSLKIRDVCDK